MAEQNEFGVWGLMLQGLVTDEVARVGAAQLESLALILVEVGRA